MLWFGPIIKDWKLFDELYASFSRPTSIYLSAFSLAGSLPLALVLKSSDLIVCTIVGALGGLAGATAWFRTKEKDIAAKADTENKKTEATKEIAKNNPPPDSTVVRAEIKQ